MKHTIASLKSTDLKTFSVDQLTALETKLAFYNGNTRAIVNKRTGEFGLPFAARPDQLECKDSVALAGYVKMQLGVADQLLAYLEDGADSLPHFEFLTAESTAVPAKTETEKPAAQEKKASLDEQFAKFAEENPDHVQKRREKFLKTGLHI